MTETEQTSEIVIETVPVSSIKRQDNLQVRVKTNAATVTEYARAMLGSTEGGALPATFPPILCYQLRKDGPLILCDGAHRVAATLKAFGEDATIRVEIRRGTRQDALKAALESGKKFGLRFSNADKNRAVRMLLSDPKLAKEHSDHEVAAMVGVSQPFVSKVRAHLATDNGYQPETTEKDPVAPLLARVRGLLSRVPESERQRARDAVAALLAEVAQ